MSVHVGEGFASGGVHHVDEGELVAGLRVDDGSGEQALGECCGERGGQGEECKEESFEVLGERHCGVEYECG